MKPGLFRREVIESRRRHWLGEIQLARPLSLTLLTTFVAATALGTAAFLSLGEYTRKARVTGVLVPDRGVIRIVPPQAAVVHERHAIEGATVKAGDTLFVLSLEQTSASGDTQAAVQRSLSARERSLQGSARQQQLLLDTQRAALQQRRSDMQRELDTLSAEAALQRERLALAQQALARLESLRSDNFVSSAQVQTKTEEVLGLKAQAHALERQRTAHLREIATLEAQLRQLPLLAQVRQDEIERDMAELGQVRAESEARRHLVIRAPADGVLSAVLAQPGQPVSPQAALATLLPAGAKLQAHLYAPSRAVGFLRPEQPVLLRYQAFPYQKFGHQQGRVQQVSRTPLPANELGAAAAGEPLYRITVELDRQALTAHQLALTPGMQLEADVLLERRRLIEWIFEPVLGLTGRV